MGMGTDPLSTDPGVSGRGTLSMRIVRDGVPVSNEIQASMDRATASILDEAYARARESLLHNRDKLSRVAAYLYEHERIDNAEFEALFAGTLAPSDNMAEEWRSAKSQPRSWDEIATLAAFIGDSSIPAKQRPPSAGGHKRRLRHGLLDSLRQRLPGKDALLRRSKASQSDR
jgi:hypothetical protein